MPSKPPRIETRTKIVATLGPASWDTERLLELICAGVDVFRINCSHSDHDAIRRQVARVRRAAMSEDRPIAILLDLQGPKIRTGRVDTPLTLDTGDILTIVMSEDLLGEGHRVGTTYPEMAGDVKPGDEVLFADGALSGQVVEVRQGAVPEVDIRIENGGELGSHKGINLPGVKMSVPCITDKDKADTVVGLEVGVDYIALSFVRRGDDVRELRSMIPHDRNVPLIAKIEKPEALDNLTDILEASDGVMVARGDLGVEVPLEAVPVHQKHIIQQAAQYGKLCITATQMLDSMERNPRPTRAETTDVANAILDGTDAVMLSGETSIGRFPVLSVQTMDRIARRVEDSRFFTPTPLADLPHITGRTGATLRATCFTLSEGMRPLMIFTWSGATARFVSKVRPSAPIYAFSPRQQVVDQLALVWGVRAFHLPPMRTIEEMIAGAQRQLLEHELVEHGQELLVVGGDHPETGATCFMKIHITGE